MKSPQIARRSFVKATALAGGAAIGALAFSRSTIYLLRRVVEPNRTHGDTEGAARSCAARSLDSLGHVEVREGEELVVGRSARFGTLNLEGGGRLVIRGARQVHFSAVNKRA